MNTYMKIRSAMLVSALMCCTGVYAQREQADTGKFEPTWESLSQYETPEWFRKIGRAHV